MRWRRRLGGAPVCQLTSNGTLAATIALATDLVEQKGCDVLALTPTPGQIRQERVEGSRPPTMRAEEVIGNFSTGESTDGLAVQPYTTGDGADG